jgi:hypothetical protein
MVKAGTKDTYKKRMNRKRANILDKQLVLYSECRKVLKKLEKSLKKVLTIRSRCGTIKIQ